MSSKGTPHTIGEPNGGGSQERRPQIFLARGLLAVISDYVSLFQQARGQDIETGGMLTGHFRRGAAGSVIKITGFISAGPNAECSKESVLFDAEYQARIFGETRVPRAPAPAGYGNGAAL